jgi:hypothetical protein
MEFINEKTIKIERDLSELDKLVLDFISILQKHSPYVLVSGYVAIVFGRTRTTEDVDFFIERMDKETFSKFYFELKKGGFWSVNVDSEEELYSILNDGLSIRFALDGQVVPNMEVKFVKDGLDRFTIDNKIKLMTKGGDLWISRIELQIAYKKFVLKSQKDMEDARHLQGLLEINDETLNKYKELIKEYGRL